MTGFGLLATLPNDTSTIASTVAPEIILISLRPSTARAWTRRSSLDDETMWRLDSPRWD